MTSTGGVKYVIRPNHNLKMWLTHISMEDI